MYDRSDLQSAERKLRESGVSLMPKCSLKVAVVVLVVIGCWRTYPQQERPPDELWRISADEAYMSKPVVAPDGTIYVATWQWHADIPPFNIGKNEFWAVMPDGKTKWRLELGKETFAKPVVARDGTVTVVSNGRLVQLSSEGKRLRERHLITPDNRGQPVPVAGLSGLSVASDGMLYVVGRSSWSEPMTLFALDSMLNIKWRCNLGKLQADDFLVESLDTAIVWRNDGTILVGLSDGRLCCVNSQGRFLWNCSIPTFKTSVSNTPALALGADGTIYASVTGGEVCAISAFGRILWRSSAESQPNRLFVSGPPIIGSDETIYAVLVNKQFTALSPKSKVLWTYALPPDSKFANNLVLTADQSLVVSVSSLSDFKSWLYRFSLDGQKVQRRRDEYRVQLTPAPQGGIVYVASASREGLRALDSTKWEVVKQ